MATVADRSYLGYRKLVNFHLKSAGLSEYHFLDKYLLWTRYRMIVLVSIFVSLELCGVVITLIKGNFTVAQIVIPFQYVFIIGCTPVEAYILIYRTNVARKCVANSTEMLHCLSCVDEKMIRQKHMPLFQFFIWVYVLSVYIAVLFVTVISPIVRFVFKIGTTSYICCPLWYPFDIFSSRALFWAAFSYEALLFCFVAHAYSNINIAFLQVFTLARVRLDALNQFFRDVTSGGQQQALDSCGKELKFNEFIKGSEKEDGVNISQVNDNLTCNQMTSSGRNSHLNLERLKKGVEDLYNLQRQARLICDTFKVSFTSCHLVGFLSISVMCFASANELRNVNKALIDRMTESFFFLFIAITATSQPIIASYNTDLLQDAYDKLRFSLYESDWYTEIAEFKKLFILVQSVLKQPLTMKAYSFYPINLRTFNSSLKGSWSYFLFLHQLTASKK